MTRYRHSSAAERHAAPAIVRHPFLVLMIFTAAYFTTITVKANAQDAQVQGDAIQVQSNDQAVITGTITKIADDNFEMSSNSKVLRIFLSDIDMKGPPSSIFRVGENVSVRGDLRGTDFGVMEVRAKSVVASANPAANHMTDGAPYIQTR